MIRPVTSITEALRNISARDLPIRESGPFYEPPSSLPKLPGELVRTEPARFYLDPFRLVPAPARTERVMYTTTTRDDEVIAVTGTVLSPTRPRRKRADRGLVAFAAGTQGMGDQCAPSKQMAAGREYESVFIAGLLARGYNVVVPDYQGLGMSGTHTYMSREVQGRVVLDALRAAQLTDNPDIPGVGPVAIAGYSQGGGAAASAAEMWHDYAPELELKGVVCGAVPADLALVARALDGSAYFAFLGYALIGLSSDYGVDIDGLLNEKGRRIVAALSTQCLFESLRKYAFTRTATLTASGQTIEELLDDGPLGAIVDDQLLGNGRFPRVDTLLTHSMLDDVIPYECGRGLAERWVRQGARVRLHTNYAPTHIAGLATSYASAFRFLGKRFAGEPMRGNTARYLHGLLDAEPVQTTR